MTTPRTQRVSATRRFTIEFTFGKNAEFIETMNTLAIQEFGEGLDSLDLGDAMGAAMEMAVTHFGDWTYVSEDLTFSITSTYHDDLFEWTPDV